MEKQGTIYWKELITNDQKESGDFYTKILGWSRKEMEMGSMGIYTLFQINGKDVADMMNPLTDYSKSKPPFWSPYIVIKDKVEHFWRSRPAIRFSSLIYSF